MTSLSPAPLPFLGLSKSDIDESLLACGVEATKVRMRRNQLIQAVYCHGEADFDLMTTLGKDLREQMKKSFLLSRPEIVREEVSRDGTRKWLLRLPSSIESRQAPEVEMVYIPERERGTLCVSSQVGCTLNCRFCYTGTQKLVRNLTPSEIVGQVMLARDRLGDWPKAQRDETMIVATGERAITNIVFMGMGEPLFNYPSVVSAIKCMTRQGGLGYSRRRVTVSTAGVVPEIVRLGEETDAALAISLHAVRDDLRDEIVPINRKYPLHALLEACRAYPNLSNTRRITFEYVMLQNVNDRDQDAYELIRLLDGIPAKVNLIPFNSWPDAPYRSSTADRIKAFADILSASGFSSPIRRPRGKDILAACGQLRSDSLRLSARERRDQQSAIV